MSVSLVYRFAGWLTFKTDDLPRPPTVAPAIIPVLLVLSEGLGVGVAVGVSVGNRVV